MSDSEHNTPAALPQNTPAGVVVIENVTLELFEKAVFTRNYEKASQELLVALRRMKGGAQWVGYPLNDRVQAALFTRFAAAVIALFTDPGYGISQDGFDHFASEHAIMDIMFRASIFDTSDHMLPMLSSNPDEMDRAKLQVSDGATLVKFLLTYSLRSSFGMDFKQTFEKNPQIMFSLWAGMISPLLTVAVQASERREELLGMWPIFENANVPDGVLATLSDSYMYSSYGVRKDKHDMKAMVHKLFAKKLQTAGVRVPDASLFVRRRRERVKLLPEVMGAYNDGTLRGAELRHAAAAKPTILICTEWFTHLHAMFRCYAPVIAQLRNTFKLVGMSRACDIDEEAKKVFDEWHEIPADRLVFGDIVRTIVSDIRPDIIYYPSLGMAMWWVVLASVRLAPIQCMSLGHPASSRSPCIDYVICETTSIGDPSLFTERIVAMPPASTRFVMRPDGEAVPWDIPMEEHPPVVRVAIPAMLCKLNAPFMATLREIAETPRARAGYGVEFHFFINMIGVNFLQAMREIRDWIPSAIVHGRKNYPDYLMELRRCHVHLCTFPFGGTNSNIDSMLLGIPILAMEGQEPHERFDAVMVRHAGLPEFLVAKSKEEYVRMANRLIDEDDLRQNLNKRLRRADLKGLFFGEPTPDRAFAFLDAMTTLYENHEALQVSDKTIYIEPREA